MLLLWHNPFIALMQLLNGLALGMNLFITALGLSLVFGVMRVINFAHGILYMLGAYIVFSLVQVWHLPYWIGVISAMIGVAAIASVIERLALRRLYDQEHLLQLLFTFAIVLIVGDAVRWFWGSAQHTVDYPALLEGAFDLGVFPYPRYLMFLIVVGIGIALIFQYFLYHTLLGQRLQAAQWDRYMLAALGVDTQRLYWLIFAIGGGLAGLGGALAAPRLAVDPGMANLIIIDCFLIVIIGGMGSLWGGFWAAVLIGQAKVFGTFILREWEVTLVYGLLVLIMLWRPWGLFGNADQARD